MTNMSIQALWLTYFIEILLVLEFQLTKTYFGTFSYKAHFRPQISSNDSRVYCVKDKRLIIGKKFWNFIWNWWIILLVLLGVNMVLEWTEWEHETMDQEVLQSAPTVHALRMSGLLNFFCTSPMRANVRLLEFMINYWDHDLGCLTYRVRLWKLLPRTYILLPVYHDEEHQST